MNMRIGLLVAMIAVASAPPIATAAQLSDAEVDNIVRRSYQYVAMYNVNNKFAEKQGGWNACDADTALKDHTMREIARPNNDTLYVSCMLDLRADAVVLDLPAFDSDYASLMVTGYDHYVSIPMASRRGDFRRRERVLFYTARTKGYRGEPVDGVARRMEATGDFVSAVLRIMPHASEPERFARIVAAMQSVTPITLSAIRGEAAKLIEDAAFPPVGDTDADVFGSHLLEVMQFVFNHTTFDPDDPLDGAVIAAHAPLGVAPGRAYVSNAEPAIDGRRFREAAVRAQKEWLDRLSEPATMTALTPRIFQPKGETDLEATLAVSIIGPIGLPQEEAVYPSVATSDGAPMNALHDYVIRMAKDALPPAGAFWSLTLYDRANGFFIPNERKKYSVGANAGMVLNADGGIEIFIAAERPEDVPLENWLPIHRRDEVLSPQLRVYVPDLERMKTWRAPQAERLTR